MKLGFGCVFFIVSFPIIFAGFPVHAGDSTSAVPEEVNKPTSLSVGDSMPNAALRRPILELSLGAGLIMVAHVGICIAPHRSCFAEFEAASSYLAHELSLVAGYQHAIRENMLFRAGIGYVEGLIIGLSEAPNKYYQGPRLRTGLAGWWRARPAFGWKLMVNGTVAENAWPIGAYAGLFAGI